VHPPPRRGAGRRPRHHPRERHGPGHRAALFDL